MSDNKKYYYLKLKDNFFDNEKMIILESMPDGYIYSNILLKLYLRSLKGEGRLMFNDRIPYNPTLLAQITRHSVGDVQRAIEIFEQFELIDKMDNGALYMLDIQNFIGHSSTEADRQRDYQKRLKESNGNDPKLLECKKSNKKSNKVSNKKSTPEKEIELKKELNINNQDVEEIWSHYPKKMGKAKAFISIPKLLKEYTKQQLISAIKEYDKSVKNKEYLAHGSTFFNGLYLDFMKSHDEVTKPDIPIIIERIEIE